MRCRGLALLALLGSLVSCGSERISGTTIETENLQARILQVDSVLPTWTDPGQHGIVATLRFDSTNFDFSRALDGGHGLVVERLDATPIPFEVVFWDRAARLGRLQVRFDRAFLSFEKAFRIRWNLRDSLGHSDSAETWRDISPTRRDTLESVLVDDFESGDFNTKLPTRPYWQTAVAESSSIQSLSLAPAGMGRSGTALGVAYIATESIFAVLKTNLVIDGSPRNVRAMDSVVFWARGSAGSGFFVAFEYRGIFKSWNLQDLDTVWTRYSIAPGDMMAAEIDAGGNRGWEAVRDSVTNLSFILNNGRSFWVDDIRIYGINPDDLR